MSPSPDDALPTRVADALRAAVSPDRVVTEGPGYDAAVAIWNGAVARRPGVVLRCADAADAQAGVRVARELGMPLSVRGGGHDWAGRALVDGGLTLDVSGMREVTVSPDAAEATVAGGATAADLANAAVDYGLSPVTGTGGTIGMVGLALGGGYGPLSGRCGLAVDNVLSVELVLADGTLVTADAEHQPELFWALRGGGGGNFGVVTSMRVRLHALPSLLSGLVLFPWEQAGSLLAALDDIVLDCPDDLTVQNGYVIGPDGDRVFFVIPTWSGAPAGGEAAIASITGLGTPLMAEVGPATVPHMLAGTDALFPFGRHVQLRPRTVARLTTGVRAALLNAGEAFTSPLSAVSMHSLHGAPTRVPLADTAFGRRDPHLVIEAIAVWEADDPNPAAHGTWARGLSAGLAGEALPGGYPNLLGPDEHEQIADAFGANTDRLLAAKERFDPDGVFNAQPLPRRAAEPAVG